MLGPVSSLVAPPLRTTITNDSCNHQCRPTLDHSYSIGQRTISSPPPSSSRAKPSPDLSSPKKKSPEKHYLLDEPPLNNPDLGPFLLKLARDTIALGGEPIKTLDYALRASKSFERCAIDGYPNLDLVMSLHIVAAIYYSLGRFEEAIPVLDRAIKVPDVSRGADHALAAFSGYMQLGDTYLMLGQLHRSIKCYKEGLKIQLEALGDTDPRVVRTCRYLAEAHVQATEFDEAYNLCKKILEIHRLHSPPASLEEAADRRLMALICEAKEDYEAALEHLVLASMAMITNAQDNEVAVIDLSIGNIYLSLSRFDDAVFSYQKALTVFKSSKGDNHPSVASVFVRLADLYCKTGKLRESRSYCENALRVYAKPISGMTAEGIASGMIEISAIYESFNEPEEALKLLQKSLKLLEDKPGQQSTVAGIEARIGVMFYMVRRYEEARGSFESAVVKLRASGERKSEFVGVVLNHMGLACVQLFKIDEAAELFEEAREILEHECGPCHQSTLQVYRNLAATYDALGRIEDTIEMLECIVGLGKSASPDFVDEKKRLTELLQEDNRKTKLMENLIDSKETSSIKWSAFGFKG